MIVTTAPAGVVLPKLRRVVAGLLGGRGRVRECLERVAVARVFDVVGLGEVLGELGGEVEEERDVVEGKGEGEVRREGGEVVGEKGGEVEPEGGQGGEVGKTVMERDQGGETGGAIGEESQGGQEGEPELPRLRINTDIDEGPAEPESSPLSELSHTPSPLSPREPSLPQHLPPRHSPPRHQPSRSPPQSSSPLSPAPPISQLQPPEHYQEPSRGDSPHQQPPSPSPQPPEPHTPEHPGLSPSPPLPPQPSPSQIPSSPPFHFHPRSPSPVPKPTPPSLILITHTSTLLTTLFATHDTPTAHTKSHLLAARLRRIARSPTLGLPLILLLNATAPYYFTPAPPPQPPPQPTSRPPPGSSTIIVPTTMQQLSFSSQQRQLPQPQTAARPEGHKPQPEASLRSIFGGIVYLPPLPGGGRRAMQRNRPSYGMVFARLVEVHLLCTRVARTRGDVELRRKGVGAECEWVVEVLGDEVGVFEMGGGEKGGVRWRSREQSWGVVDVDGWGRVVDGV